MTYSQFRTGLNFRDIRLILKLEADSKYRAGEYMYITRHTVLGRWHEIKLREWHIWQEYENYGSINEPYEEENQCT